MRGNVLEAGDLGVLRRQVVDRVEDQVRERERPLDASGREVPDRHADQFSPRFRLELRDHRLREVDAVYLHAALGEGKGDPPGTDPELEGRTRTGERGEEVDGWADDRRIEPVRGGLVVALGHSLAEVVLRHEADFLKAAVD